MSAVALSSSNPIRPIAHRSRGHVHGPIPRLISPSDLGEIVKPFVFLDLFENEGKSFDGFGLHPHSGIATLTYIAEGSVNYEDPNGARGVLGAGAVEWMHAGAGVWHGGGAGDIGRTRGFQLWIALPPHLELGESLSLYQSAGDVPVVGPARVLLGRHEGSVSAIRAPSAINYLAVTLKSGETWRYQPPRDHTVLWIAVGKGEVTTPHTVSHGEIAVFEPGTAAVEFIASDDTSPEALAKGEAQIQAIRRRLVEQGRL